MNKREIAQGLAHFLADTWVVYVKTLRFHWNMRGAEFFMYHKLLEEQYKEMADAIDEIAERIRMLGHAAPGSMEEFLGLACLKESKGALSQEGMVKALVQDHQSLVEHCQELIAFTDAEKDYGSSDLLIERLRTHDKAHWLLASHLKK